MSRSDTRTTVDTKVGVSTFEETYSYAMNKSIEMMLNYIKHRGLNPDRFNRKREKIEDGLWMWIAGRHIKQFKIEVYEDEGDKLVERFDLHYEITDPDDLSPEERQDIQEKNFKAYHEEVMEAISQYDAPPENVTYRMLIRTEENEAGQDPPDVPGWSRTTPKDASHLDRVEKGDAIDAGNVDTAYEFWK